VAIILSYIVEYENFEGEIHEAEVDVDYAELVASVHSDSLDETARRFIVSSILEKGGRVIKIRKK